MRDRIGLNLTAEASVALHQRIANGYSGGARGALEVERRAQAGNASADDHDLGAALFDEIDHELSNLPKTTEAVKSISAYYSGSGGASQPFWLHKKVCSCSNFCCSGPPQ